MDAPIHLQERTTTTTDERSLRLLFGIKRLGRLGRRNDPEEGRNVPRKESISAPHDARVIGKPTRNSSLAPTPARSGSRSHSLTPNDRMSPKLSPAPTGSKSPQWRMPNSGPGSPSLSGTLTPPTNAPTLTGRSIRFPDEAEQPDELPGRANQERDDLRRLGE